MNKSVPSPFWGKEPNEDFLSAVDALCKSHGFNDWFIAFGESSEEETTWQASSKQISDGLIEFLGIIREKAQEELDEYQGDNL